MAKGDTKTNQYLDIAANGTRADLPTDTCCETRSQTLIREVAERIMDVEDEVEELKNNPDVVDIVATYADLQAYDTQHLTDKDIVRVLQDETHDGESTYYRYNKQSDTWTYVGTVGDYYTKTAADAKFQDKLTAGSNITISDQNVISATDTTYSNFTGTDGTTAGTAGLVPAPTTTDGDKYLKGDGTWGTVQAGSNYTAGDGINISAQDVISATNTGKAKELTTDDYNYPNASGTTADCIALWLLEPGTYSFRSGVMVKASILDTYGLVAYGIHTCIVGQPKNNGRRCIVCYNSEVTTSNPCVVYYIVDSNGAQQSKRFITNVVIEDTLTSTANNNALSANQGKVLKDLIDSVAIRAAGAPTTSTVGSVGTLYEDTTNGKLYQCTDTTGGSYTWVEVGAGGSGPTVVQTTGTSTTDVMSQNATTSMVFADPSTKYNVQIGSGASASGTNSIAIGRTASATGNSAVGIKGKALALNSVAIGGGAQATAQGQFDIGTGNGATTGGYNNSAYRLLTGLYDGQSAHDAATVGQALGTTETYTIATSDWSALSSSSPYTYQATVTATYTIGNSTIAELINDSPIDFATYGFAIGSISSQSVTIYSIGQPSASVSLKVNYKG